MSEVYIGMGGWSLPAFENVFYPPNVGKEFRRLEYLSRFFDLVEVNVTFYTTALTPRQSSRWIQEVSHNERFQFTVKLYQGFTHTMDATGHDVVATHRLLEPFMRAGKLGGVLLQFPHSFVNSEEHRHRLIDLSGTFKRYRLFVELRHNSWNHPHALRFLQEHALHWVNVDLPQIKHHVPLTSYAWGDTAYFRLMGRNAAAWDRGVQHRYHYFYSEAELEEIADRIRETQPRVQKTFVVFHNDPNAHSPVNGFQLRRMLDESATIVVPSNLVGKFPQLKELGTIKDVSTLPQANTESSASIMGRPERG